MYIDNPSTWKTEAGSLFRKALLDYMVELSQDRRESVICAWVSTTLLVFPYYLHGRGHRCGPLPSW